MEANESGWDVFLLCNVYISVLKHIWKGEKTQRKIKTQQLQGDPESNTGKKVIFCPSFDKKDGLDFKGKENLQCHRYILESTESITWAKDLLTGI